jgi:hypothetical protein
MLDQRIAARPASGNVYLLKGKRGAVWYMRYRLDGRESRKRIGPAWTGRAGEVALRPGPTKVRPNEE